MFDYHGKQHVLLLELDKEERRLKRAIYEATKATEIDGDYNHISDAITAYGQAKSLNGFAWTLAQRLNYSRYKRVQRIKKRVKAIVSKGEAVFLTLTFTDEVLATTSDKTRRVYVSRYLKAATPVYVANKDYGKEKGREHYHAIVSGSVDLAPWRCYGSINAKRVRNRDLDLVRTSKYVAKLTHHAIKHTAALSRLIVSRK